ncbi:hypothetical protein Tco_1091872 [Tanacetum coccineum]|uniref:Uncharacterized protein n=1 Tax=Tanacetum coccineum TaxID=301880 RepID=A0ABQ5I894_9ASTR
MLASVQFMLMSTQELDVNNVYVGSFQTLQSTSMDTSTNLITMQPMAIYVLWFRFNTTSSSRPYSSFCNETSSIVNWELNLRASPKSILAKSTQGKLMLNSKFVSYQGKFMNQYKQPSKDSQQLICYKKMIAQQERSSKELENVFWLLSPKLAEED